MNETNLSHLPHDCAIQLQAVYDTLKSAERKAANFILSHPENIFGLSIVDFADHAGCSEATVVRLSKKLGYEGYPELKAAFRLVTIDEPGVEYENITDGDSATEVLRKVVEASVIALQDTAKVMDEDQYIRALDSMVAARRIMFCGVGDAGTVAAEAYQRWVRMGQECYNASDHDLQLILASKLDSGDVLFAISHSGRTRTVLNVAHTAQQQGAIVIALTNYPISPLAKHADIILQTAVFSRLANGEVMSKRIAELCVLESLSINFLIRKGESHLRSLGQSNEVVSINKV
ncbi:MAG TPA: MurR/RpiR family transcriptional regulator [Spirochaetia bacterium]|nr:MurR/RpiR family transcriptional regulator [Spirochaetia bacterium]